MAEEDDEVKAICSACMEPFDVEDVRVIPSYNDFLRNYVTTYRCEKCWEDTFNKTRTRLASTALDREILSMIEFFERYHIFIKEYREGASKRVVKDLLLKLLDRLKSGETKLEIDTTTMIKLPDL